jgi:hypothetical protein
MNPRRMITQHLLDGYDPSEDLRGFDVREEMRGMDPRQEVPSFDIHEEIRKAHAAENGNGQQPEPAYLRKDGHAPSEASETQRSGIDLRKEPHPTPEVNGKPNGYPLNVPVSEQRPLAAGEWPSFDPDAT